MSFKKVLLLGGAALLMSACSGNTTAPAANGGGGAASSAKAPAPTTKTAVPGATTLSPEDCRNYPVVLGVVDSACVIEQ